MTASRVAAELKKRGAKKVKVAITDMDGLLRGKFINIDKFESAMSGGFGFCNVVLGWDSADVCYDNVAYTGWHSGYPDAAVQLDTSTLRFIPWEQETPFLLGDFWETDTQPLPICPRQLLKSVVARAQNQGFEAKFGCEFEWFNFRETAESLQEKGFRSLTPLTPGMFGYSLLRSSREMDFFNRIIDDLAEFGVPLEGLHTETGPGVYEAAIAVADALEAADRAILFKTSVKQIANQHNITASFMARWNMQLPGCSGHLHQSLLDKSGKNAFFAEKDPNKMSPTLKHYIAGVMHCLPHILPMFAPTVNSYKRLVEGYWAPTTVTWAIDNRTAAIRYIPGSAKSTRIELRVPGSDVNPYLGIAASLAAGLYGIENKLELTQEPIEGNCYAAEGATKLPNSLSAATEAFASSKVAKELFGDSFVDHFANTRRWEWRQSQQAVTDWELQRYFELI